MVPPSGTDHAINFPNGHWRIEDDAIRWVDWHEPEHCVSALAEVGDSLWAGTRDGLLFERSLGRFSQLDAPNVVDTIYRILPLTEELVLLAGDAGLFGVTDGAQRCLAPKLWSGTAATFKELHRVGDELLVITSEADQVKNVIVMEL